MRTYQTSVISSGVYYRNRVGVVVTTTHSSVSARAVECAAVVPSATDLFAIDLSAVDPAAEPVFDPADRSEAEPFAGPAVGSVVDPFDRSEAEPAADPAADSAVDPFDRSEADCGLAYARMLSTL